jgi:CDP-glycerol glycerophosphotransferase (TagB/SpsB family)
MMECKMLITDYSSVCWDVFYQGKPIIFYQFDIETYNLTNGSYIDMDKELFGDRVFELDSLILTIEDYIHKDFKLPEKYAKMRLSSYKYIDTDNSKRICEEIQRRKW